MYERNFLDSIIKSSLKVKTYSIEPSKDIFEEAWKNKDNNVKKISIIKTTRTVAVIATCFIIFSFSAIIAFSSTGKTLADEAYKKVRTIFIVEKVGDEYKVVEKLEDAEQNYWNIGGVEITNANKEELENKIGFKFYLPEKVSEDFINGHSSIGMTVYGIKIKDSEAFRDKFYKAITDDTAFQQLNKFKKERFVSAEYCNTYGGVFYLYMSNNKERLDYKGDKVIKELDIENVKCRIVEKMSAEYPIINDGKWVSDDVTQKPKKINKLNYVIWNYNGVNYSVTTLGNFEYDKAINFIQGYIKGLKQQNIK